MFNTIKVCSWSNRKQVNERLTITYVPMLSVRNEVIVVSEREQPGVTLARDRGYPVASVGHSSVGHSYYRSSSPVAVGGSSVYRNSSAVAVGGSTVSRRVSLPLSKGGSVVVHASRTSSNGMQWYRMGMKATSYLVSVRTVLLKRG